MKLYYSPISPYSQKVLIAVHEKNAKCDLELVNLGDADARAAYEKVNPFGKVPFLRDDARDWSVPESSMIIEYLDQYAPGATRLVPQDPELSRQARSQDRIADWYITEPAVKIFFDGRRPAEKRDAMGVESAEKRLDKTYALYDHYLAKKTWVLGDAFSIGDCAAASALGIARMVRPFDKHANLMAYFGRLRERPSVAHTFQIVEQFMAQR